MSNNVSAAANQAAILSQCAAKIRLLGKCALADVIEIVGPSGIGKTTLLRTQIESGGES